jgi:hypothetical protein
MCNTCKLDVGYSCRQYQKKTVIVFVIRIKSCEICVIIITSIVELSIKRLDL